MFDVSVLQTNAFPIEREIYHIETRYPIGRNKLTFRESISWNNLF